MTLPAGLRNPTLAAVEERGSASVELLNETWSAIATLCADLDERGFLTSTDCPGWTVKDVLSHILGTERSLRGEPAPEAEVGGDHIRNHLGRFNERWVASRRSLPGSAVLAEFLMVTAEQTQARRCLTREELAAPTPTPFGEMPMETWIDTRLFDCFSHEQDIRRALGRPGGLAGAAADRAVQRGAVRLPRTVGRALRGSPDGTRIEVVIDDDPDCRWLVEIRSGRGELADGAAGRADATLSMDRETFLCLIWGRWTAKRAEASGRLALTGDAGLARLAASNLTITP